MQSIILGPTAALVRPELAYAAMGAAELDLEYYARDLLGGNRKEGNVLPSQPPILPPPRTLQAPLLPLLLDNAFVSSVPVQTLIDMVQKRSNTNKQSIAEEIRARAEDYRTKAARSFATHAPWLVESVQDQYYFDLTAYALWRTASDLLPNYRDRDAFVREIGKRVLAQLEKSERVPLLINDSKSLVASIPRIIAVLDAMVALGFCKSYRLGEKLKPKEELLPLFDKLDDDALAAGSTVDCLLSVFEPATLGASLQITGEQSRFAPDYVGPTIAALWLEQGIQATWETFFVDNEYRPNPKDYFPNEQLLQFTLSKAS